MSSPCYCVCILAICRRRKLLFHLNSSGKYHVFKEQLKVFNIVHCLCDMYLRERTTSHINLVQSSCRIDLWTMSITTLVVIFSAPMLNSPGGVVVRASDWYLEDPGSIPGYI